MANCNKLFLDFEKEISLSPTQITDLRKSRTALEKQIRTVLSANAKIKFKGFFIQGSLAPTFQTGVLKSKDKTYDVDLGVYLNEKPTDITCTTVQNYVFDAVNKHTTSGASHLSKCIRLKYAGAFDIDLPVYYQGESDQVPYIAVKDKDWTLDDPKGTAEWFRAKKKGTNGQLVKVIKYLKAWADKDIRGFKMPSGFALSVWAADNFSADEREDIALLSTLKAIKLKIASGVTCTAPKAPFDDLTANLDATQKGKFKTALNEFIDDAEKAIASKNQLAASKLWQKHLGTRFKDGADEDVDKKEEELRAKAALITGNKAKTDQSGNIQEKEGVSNLKHRNFGK